MTARKIKRTKRKAATEDDRAEVVSLRSCSDGASVRDYIPKPRELDICCGRGKGFFSHPGNQIFQAVVRNKAEKYTNASSKNLKSELVSEMVEELYSQGTRFIKRDPDYGNKWYVLSPALAHEKTGHAVRDYLMQQRRQAAIAAADNKASSPATAGPKKVASVSKTLRSVAAARRPKSKQAMRKEKASRKKIKKSSPIKLSSFPTSSTTSNNDKKLEQSTPGTMEDISFHEYEIVSLTSSSVKDDFDLFDDLTTETAPTGGTNGSCEDPCRGIDGSNGLKRIISEGSTTSAQAPSGQSYQLSPPLNPPFPSTAGYQNPISSCMSGVTSITFARTQNYDFGCCDGGLMKQGEAQSSEETGNISDIISQDRALRCDSFVDSPEISSLLFYGNHYELTYPDQNTWRGPTDNALASLLPKDWL